MIMSWLLSKFDELCISFFELLTDIQIFIHLLYFFFFRRFLALLVEIFCEWSILNKVVLQQIMPSYY